jgi:hypothetical protein
LNRNTYGDEVGIVRQRAAFWKRNQPREQHAKAAVESEFAPRARSGERREETNAGLRGVHSRRPREESCLST